MACILKYMPYVFYDKPCVFSDVPKFLHKTTCFSSRYRCLFKETGWGVRNKEVCLAVRLNLGKTDSVYSSSKQVLSVFCAF